MLTVVADVRTILDALAHSAGVRIKKRAHDGLGEGASSDTTSSETPCRVT